MSVANAARGNAFAQMPNTRTTHGVQFLTQFIRTALTCKLWKRRPNSVWAQATWPWRSLELCVRAWLASLSKGQYRQHTVHSYAPQNLVPEAQPTQPPRPSPDSGHRREIRGPVVGPVLSYIQKEMHKLHTETTRSSDYLLKTVLLLYMLRPDAARVAGYVTTRSRSARRGRLGGRCSHCCNTLPLCSRCRRSINPSSRHYASNCLERSLWDSFPQR